MPKKSRYAFNDTQIKDGWIVRLRKDGTIKTKLEPYIVKHIKQLPKKAK